MITSVERRLLGIIAKHDLANGETVMLVKAFRKYSVYIVSADILTAPEYVVQDTGLREARRCYDQTIVSDTCDTL